jgi:NADH-quinone oxidoreductase subunit A
VLGAYELAERVCAAFGSPHYDHLSIAENAARSCTRDPVWVCYHVRYYGYALLFLAFDMEMAYMYP